MGWEVPKGSHMLYGGSPQVSARVFSYGGGGNVSGPKAARMLECVVAACVQGFLVTLRFEPDPSNLVQAAGVKQDWYMCELGFDTEGLQHAHRGTAYLQKMRAALCCTILSVVARGCMRCQQSRKQKRGGLHAIGHVLLRSVERGGLCSGDASDYQF